MTQEQAIVFLHDRIATICHECGVEAEGLSLSANRSVVFVYVTHRWQHRILNELLPETLEDFTVIVKYRGNSGRAVLANLTPKELP